MCMFVYGSVCVYAQYICMYNLKHAIYFFSVPVSLPSILYTLNMISLINYGIFIWDILYSGYE